MTEQDQGVSLCVSYDTMKISVYLCKNNLRSRSGAQGQSLISYQEVLTQSSRGLS